jgi:hypothetical protein
MALSIAPLFLLPCGHISIRSLASRDFADSTRRSGCDWSTCGFCHRSSFWPIALHLKAEIADHTRAWYEMKQQADVVRARACYSTYQPAHWTARRRAPVGEAAASQAPRMRHRGHTSGGCRGGLFYWPPPGLASGPASGLGRRMHRRSDPSPMVQNYILCPIFWRCLLLLYNCCDVQEAKRCFLRPRLDRTRL